LRDRPVGFHPDARTGRNQHRRHPNDRPLPSQHIQPRFASSSELSDFLLLGATASRMTGLTAFRVAARPRR
jgi:hypothetical protein